MLSLNKITIKGLESSISEIFSILNSASVLSDVSNYHRFSSDKSEFVKLFFEEDDDFEFEWAYVESCEILEGSILAKIYSHKGNLAAWASRLHLKYYIDDASIEVFSEIEKSVKYVNYEVERDWEYGESMPIDDRKDYSDDVDSENKNAS